MNRSGVMRHVPSVATAVPGILVRRTASHRVPQKQGVPWTGRRQIRCGQSSRRALLPSKSFRITSRSYV